jgi:hypothetical protein
MVADGVLLISPETNAIEPDVQGNIRSIESIHSKYYSTKAEKGKLSFLWFQRHCDPCPQNSLVVMGGSFQENMVHGTDRRVGYVDGEDRGRAYSC